MRAPDTKRPGRYVNRIWDNVPATRGWIAELGRELLRGQVAMVAALIAGERDPRTLADLAKGPLRARKDALAEALDGMFDSHHGVIAQALLDQVAFLDQRIAQMEAGAIEALAQVEESWGVD